MVAAVSVTVPDADASQAHGSPGAGARLAVGTARVRHDRDGALPQPECAGRRLAAVGSGRRSAAPAQHARSVHRAGGHRPRRQVRRQEGPRPAPSVLSLAAHAARAAGDDRRVGGGQGPGDAASEPAEPDLGHRGTDCECPRRADRCRPGPHRVRRGSRFRRKRRLLAIALALVYGSATGAWSTGSPRSGSTPRRCCASRSRCTPRCGSTGADRGACCSASRLAAAYTMRPSDAVAVGCFVVWVAITRVGQRCCAWRVASPSWWSRSSP